MNHLNHLLRNPLFHLIILVFGFVWSSWAFLTDSFVADKGVGYISLFLKWIVMVVGLVIISHRLDSDEGSSMDQSSGEVDHD